MHYRKIWENYNKTIIPEGYEIHHIDGNRNNNDITNLKCVSIEEHLKIHKQNKDWGAVQAILARMENREGIKESAREFQKQKLKEGKHNFQKMTAARRTEISKNTIETRKSKGQEVFLGIADKVENARKGGKKAAEKNAGFLNINAETHGSKHVKGTCWWTNIETGERKRSKLAPNKQWTRGMK